ncbi:hypothetical protein KKP97_04185 [Methanothermococcus sp. SCGC AD-155-C09]|nr:hypothetical protein [Methanothermococcus sp. SCGC AD-155-C09]
MNPDLLYISTGKKHINYSQGKKYFTKRLKEETIIGIKDTLSREFSKKMKKKDVTFITVKRENIIEGYRNRSTTGSSLN